MFETRPSLKCLIKSYGKRFLCLIYEPFAYLFFAALLLSLYVMQPVWEGDRFELKVHSDPKQLRRHVEMLSETLGHRLADADLLEPSAYYIGDEFSKYSSDVYFQNFKASDETFKNVVARFGPGQNSSSSVYVIGAHYDSVQGLPGADDNASGVAGLLELARLFSLVPPLVEVELVAYALEEPPHFRMATMGSYHHAKSLLKAKKDVALMISLEMIGFYQDQPDTQTYPIPFMSLLYPETADFIALVGQLSEPLLMRAFKTSFIQATDLSTYSLNAPALLPGVDFSDHLNYWHFSYPAIMVTDTAFYRNLNYHTSSDTVETLDFKRMAKVVDGVFGVISQLK